MRLSGTGDVMVDSLVWNKMAGAFNTLNELTENSFDQLVERFQKFQHHHHDSSDAVALYDPTEMKNFANKHAPGLYDLIL